MRTIYGCFHTSGVLFEGVLIIRFLLFGVNSRDPGLETPTFTLRSSLKAYLTLQSKMQNSPHIDPLPCEWPSPTPKAKGGVLVS